MGLLLLVAMVAGMTWHLRRVIRLRADLEEQIRAEVLEQIAGRRMGRTGNRLRLVPIPEREVE